MKELVELGSSLVELGSSLAIIDLTIIPHDFIEQGNGNMSFCKTSYHSPTYSEAESIKLPDVMEQAELGDIG